MRKILMLALAVMLFTAACQRSEETAPAGSESPAASPAEASPEASPSAP